MLMNDQRKTLATRSTGTGGGELEDMIDGRPVLTTQLHRDVLESLRLAAITHSLVGS